MAPPKHHQRRKGTWMGIGKGGSEEQDEWLDTKRVFFVWENCKSLAGHSSIGFQYLSMVRQPCWPYLTDGSRFLKVELCHTGAGGEVFLQYTGVLKPDGEVLDLQDYTKRQQFILHASVQDVKTVCEREFDRFGDYQLVGNNCQTFTSRVLKQLQVRFKQDIEAEPAARAEVEAGWTVAVDTAASAGLSQTKDKTRDFLRELVEERRSKLHNPSRTEAEAEQMLFEVVMLEDLLTKDRGGEFARNLALRKVKQYEDRKAAGDLDKAEALKLIKEVEDLAKFGSGFSDFIPFDFRHLYLHQISEGWL